MILLIFGDSITQGYWDEHGGWADHIKRTVMAKDVATQFKYYHGVHNLGIDGNTTRQVLDRFDSEVSARKWPDSEYGVIFAIGTNDTLHRSGQDFASTPERYKEELQQLAAKARALTSNIAFVNLLPVDEKLTNPLASSKTGKCYTNERITLFNTVLEQFCEENNFGLIDAREKFSNPEQLHADGIHPNSEGHEVVYEAVLPTVQKWLYKGLL